MKIGFHYYVSDSQRKRNQRTASRRHRINNQSRISTIKSCVELKLLSMRKTNKPIIVIRDKTKPYSKLRTLINTRDMPLAIVISQYHAHGKWCCPDHVIQLADPDMLPKMLSIIKSHHVKR